MNGYNVFPKIGKSSDNQSRYSAITRKNRFIFFSVLPGIVIWFATFIVLISYTNIAILYNKLICILAVLTYWLIRWYMNARQYIYDSKQEYRIFKRFRVVLKYVAGEVFHFIILISVILMLMVFIEKYF
jgi:hypothetical protein